ncbi:7-carboxy-7-deazaguanine synthase QueE [Candidatus Pacearchaeota archaeon]|nr:7-carboxy-7-deazaguanine synthase QueE [Candidatus Pacearchaeota archaeon]
MKEVKLIENFVSWQGEGPDSGQAMIILRFKTCNMKCSWCDTSVKMRISAEAPYQLDDIQESIDINRAGILVTGGEPTVPKHIDEAETLLNALDYPIANVESNGYRLEKLINRTDTSKNVHFIYSPKFFTSEELESQIVLTRNLLSYPNLYIKVVYEDKPIVQEYLTWLSSRIKLGQSRKVWLMPEGVTRADLIRNSEDVFDACEKYKFNFSSRSHIIFGFV